MNWRQWVNVVCIIGCIAANTIPRWWPHTPSKEYGDLFCQYQALSFLLLFIGARSEYNSKVVIVLYEFGIGLAFNSFYNEKWGEPFHPGPVEIVFVILLTFITLLRVIRQCRKRKLS